MPPRYNGPEGVETNERSIRVPYYDKYDSLYSELYEKGIPFWTDGPDHFREHIAHVISRIQGICPDPKGVSILHVGCGEGRYAVPLAELGMTYAGFDFSSHAIAKARERARGWESSIELTAMDALDAHTGFGERQFDIVMDRALLHMLVVDEDRSAYLANVRRWLGEGGSFLVLDANRREDVYDGSIDSVADFHEHIDRDRSDRVERTVWDGETWVKADLPRFVTRPKPKSAYISEFEENNFRVRKLWEYERGRGHRLDFVLEKLNS